MQACCKGVAISLAEKWEKKGHQLRQTFVPEMMAYSKSRAEFEKKEQKIAKPSEEQTDNSGTELIDSDEWK